MLVLQDQNNKTSKTSQIKTCISYFAQQYNLIISSDIHVWVPGNKKDM